jgi:hypothetical protein
MEPTNIHHSTHNKTRIQEIEMSHPRIALGYRLTLGLSIDLTSTAALALLS